MPDKYKKSIINELSDLEASLNSINSYSSGIGYAIGDTLKKYNPIVDYQKETLDSFSRITETLDTVDLSGLSNIYREALTPISAAIADVGISNLDLNKFGLNNNVDYQYLNTINNLSTLALDSIEDQQEKINSLFLNVDGLKLGGINSGITSNIQNISGGLSEIFQSFETYPYNKKNILPELENSREINVTEEELSESQKMLDSVLDKINPKLVSFRKGAWETFNNKGEDYIGQASSSMRRLVDTLLRELAPMNKIEKTNFFQNNKGVKDDRGKPNRKAKLMYIVNWDEDKAEHLGRITKGFLEAYGNLGAWDHVPLNKDNFVHGVFIVIEGYLLSILSSNH